MSADLTVSDPIEEVIQKFDRAALPFTELEVHTALVKVRASLQNPSDSENFSTWAEVLAFGLMPNRRHENPWRTYFGPMGSRIGPGAEKIYFPDIGDADARVVAHWRERATAVRHPVLKARYADLVWDLCTVITAGMKRDPEMARLAIDAYLASIPETVLPDIERRFGAALRALDLAVLLRDEERIDRARSALLQLHEGVMTALGRPWWFAFDRLIDEKRAGVTEQERQRLVADLEKLVLHYGNPETFDPHTVQGAAKRLIKHYTRLSRPNDVKRLHEAIARAFEHFASLGNALLASTVLQTAVNAYRDAGLPEDSKRVRVLMQEKIGRARDHMAPVGIEISITREDIEKFLKTVVLDDLGPTFVRIAAEFLPRRCDLEDQVRSR